MCLRFFISFLSPHPIPSLTHAKNSGQIVAAPFLPVLHDLVSLRRIETKLREILPTSLPELPIQPRDLRNNQKSFKNLLFIFLDKIKNQCVWTWISDSRPLEPVLGRKYHVDFESAIKNTKFLQPEGKIYENENYKSSNTFFDLPFNGIV